MSNNYASILASKNHEHTDTSLQGDIELAFTVVEILSEARNLTTPWSKLLDNARGLIKTRAKRSRTRFKMQFKKAIENSDLTSITELPGLDLPKDREERFKLRILNPRFMSRSGTTVVIKPEIAPKQEQTIITEEKLFTKEREDEFKRRVTAPRSFRRRD